MQGKAVSAVVYLQTTYFRKYSVSVNQREPMQFGDKTAMKMSKTVLSAVCESYFSAIASFSSHSVPCFSRLFFTVTRAPIAPALSQVSEQNKLSNCRSKISSGTGMPKTCFYICHHLTEGRQARLTCVTLRHRRHTSRPTSYKAVLEVPRPAQRPRYRTGHQTTLFFR